ncbi:MAG: hypothetical protein Q9199_004178 [Rusavskia elegans]
MALLMLLPDELKLQIIANIDIDVNNTLIKLRQVHPWFRASIKRETVYDKLSAAERDRSSPLRKELSSLCGRRLVCYTCHRVLPVEAFSDRQASGSIDSLTRICVGCCIKRRWYPPGCAVIINGGPYTVCKACRGLFRWQSSNVKYCNQYSRRGKKFKTINSLADLTVTYADLAARYADALHQEHFEEQSFTYETETISFANGTHSMRFVGPRQARYVSPTRCTEEKHFTLEDAKSMLKNMRLPEIPIEGSRFHEILMETPISVG